MSNEFKLVPIEPTPEMLRAGLASNGIVPVYTAMLAAAPQPPALGGEPEVLAIVTLGGYFSSDELGDIDIEPQMSSLERIQQEVVSSDSDQHISLIDRTHFDAQQAEIERHKYKAELYDEVWKLATGLGYMNVTTAIGELRKERDQLKALANIICNGYVQQQGHAINDLRDLLSSLNGGKNEQGSDSLEYGYGSNLNPDRHSDVCRETAVIALSKPAGSEQV